jgi:glycosyltransferase involved in cell wall biosynthesis
MKNLVIIPAWNEDKCIEGVISELRRDAPGFDFVIVNDGSTDSTEEACRRVGATVLDLPVNLGIGGAVQAGYLYAMRNGYDTATQLDGDGQHPASALPAMLERLRAESADMVIGSRFIEGKGFQSARLRRIGIRLLSLWMKVLTGKTITDPTSGLRMVSRRLIRVFAQDYPNDYPEPESAVNALSRGAKIVEAPVEMRERAAGTSSISMKRSFYYMVKVSIAMAVARFHNRKGKALA